MTDSKEALRYLATRRALVVTEMGNTIQVIGAVEAIPRLPGQGPPPRTPTEVRRITIYPDKDDDEKDSTPGTQAL